MSVFIAPIYLEINQCVSLTESIIVLSTLDKTAVPDTYRFLTKKFGEDDNGK